MDDISRASNAALKELPEIEHSFNESMKNHTTMRIGGPVRVMFQPTNAREIAELYKLFRGYGITPLILGNGSNMLVYDEPLDIVAIKTTGLRGIELTGETEITAAAGAPLSKLAVFACECGLTGLEFAYGIPGTVGGAVLINAGAYNGEMKDTVYRTDAYDTEKGGFTLTGGQQRFSYRHSAFSDTDGVITSALFRLKKEDPENIKARMDELTIRRRESQPLDLPSAGSIFKRPKGGYAAELIERAGLKGYTVGGAQVSTKHSGFIVNLGNATFSDVTAVIDHAREAVLRLFGIELELEVKILENK